VRTRRAGSDTRLCRRAHVLWAPAPPAGAASALAGAPGLARRGLSRQAPGYPGTNRKTRRRGQRSRVATRGRRACGADRLPSISTKSGASPRPRTAEPMACGGGRALSRAPSQRVRGVAGQVGGAAKCLHGGGEDVDGVNLFVVHDRDLPRAARPSARSRPAEPPLERMHEARALTANSTPRLATSRSKTASRSSSLISFESCAAPQRQTCYSLPPNHAAGCMHACMHACTHAVRKHAGRGVARDVRRGRVWLRRQGRRAPGSRPAAQRPRPGEAHTPPRRPGRREVPARPRPRRRPASDSSPRAAARARGSARRMPSLPRAWRPLPAASLPASRASGARLPRARLCPAAPQQHPVAASPQRHSSLLLARPSLHGAHRCAARSQIQGWRRCLAPSGLMQTARRRAWHGAQPGMASMETHPHHSSRSGASVCWGPLLCPPVTVRAWLSLSAS
jgi:hypothetical protein